MKKDLPLFRDEDRRRTILVPWFSDFYSPYVPVLGKLLGYKFENLPPSNNASVNLGLEYANNEICYPATLVVGDIIQALRSNKHKPDETAIGITQTGGQCRATNYISLIKRGMVNSGFTDIPVIALGTENLTFNMQPGFNPNWRKAIKPAFFGLMFADCLSRLYYSTAPREKGSEVSKRIKNKYIELSKELLESGKEGKLTALLGDAVDDFNKIPVTDQDVRKVGVVGEIYIKYNTFGQFNIIDWLIENQVEVALPPLMEFFMQSFVNKKARQRDYLLRKTDSGFAYSIANSVANKIIGMFEKKLSGFRYYRKGHNIDHSARLGAEILSLNNQYGEGWLIPAEIAAFSNQGINHVICLQPFGCIANHIVGKGMEMKIKSLYPDMNLLYLDFDSGMSKVNILNRLHFLVQSIKDIPELTVIKNPQSISRVCLNLNETDPKPGVFPA